MTSPDLTKADSQDIAEWARKAAAKDMSLAQYTTSAFDLARKKGGE